MVEWIDFDVGPDGMIVNKRFNTDGIIDSEVYSAKDSAAEDFVPIIPQKTGDGRRKPAHPVKAGVSSRLKRKYSEYEKIRMMDESHSLDVIIDKIIPEIASDVIELEDIKFGVIKALKNIKYIENLFEESELLAVEKTPVYKVRKRSLKNKTIVAIDGSYVTAGFYGMDISLSRAIAVIYKYDGNGKPSVEYYPDSFGTENYKLTRILENVTEEEAVYRTSLERAYMEISLVNKLLENYTERIHMIILDGSILTEPLKFTAADNKVILEKYAKLIREYIKFYNTCNERKISAVGVIKDTRSSIFRDILKKRLPRYIARYPALKPLTSINYRRVMDYFSDMDMLRRLLDKNERTAVFNVGLAVETYRNRTLGYIDRKLRLYENIRKELDRYGFYAFYLKPVEMDLPFRVEFVIPVDKIPPGGITKYVSGICGILLSLSTHIDDYALPVPQIEAHMRAKLGEKDLGMILNLLRRSISERMAGKISDPGSLIKKGKTPMGDKFGEFLVKNDMFVRKRRERLPFKI